MLSAAAASASSSSSGASAPSNVGASVVSASSNSAYSYWDWELAMATMSGRFGNGAATAAAVAAQDAQLAVHQLSAAHAQQQQQQQQQSPTSAYYGQMAAAMSAVSGCSSGAPNAAVWYNPQAAGYGVGYYGLAAQRAAAGTAALNGYLGAANYAGAYASPADYYAAGTHFPGYYATAAALSNAAAHHQSSMDPSKAATASSFMAASPYGGMGGIGHQSQQQQQQYAASLAAAGANNPLNAVVDLQSVVTGSELDSSPLGAAGPTADSTPQIGVGGTGQIGQPQQNGGAKEKHQKEKASTGSSKRSKKKKGAAVRCSPAEPNNTRVFVWELEDICSILPAHHQFRPGLDQTMGNALAKLLQLGFQLDRFEEFDQANVEDAQMDEALQTAASAGANSGGGNGGNGGAENGRQIEEEQKVEMGETGGAEGTMMMGASGQMKGTTTANEGMRRLAAKYQLIKDVYGQHRGAGLGELLEHCGLSTDLAYLEQIERMPGANADLFRQCLRVIAERSMLLPNRCANVVLASGPTEAGVAGALGRLMLCRMAEFVQPENVFCTSRMGKEAAMERLANQFQKKLITLITANEESRLLANREGIPCWFLYADSDLAKFRGALDILIGDLLGGGAQLNGGTIGAGSIFLGGIEEQKFGGNGGQQEQGGTTAAANFLQAVRG